VPFVIPLSKDGEPLFRQIYAWFRAAILAGGIRPGERLPATRDLAEQLGVSRTVTVLAYDQLLAEGYIEGRHGSGTYASTALGARARHRPEHGTAQIHLSRFGKAVRPPVPHHHSSPGIDFSHRGCDVTAFPFELWRRILVRRARRLSLREVDYGPAAGSLALREAIADHLRRARAVLADASQIVIVSGSQQALDLAARVLLDSGDPVVVEDPQYQGARDVLRAACARLHPIPVDRDGLITTKLPPQARAALVTPSHQFPTGAILPLARRLALLEWAKHAGAVVIEDDYDGEFHYEGQPVESMQGLDTEGRVVYIGTFSRTIFPALRIGYLVVPKSLVAAFTGAKWLCDRHTPTLEQETLAEFIVSGAYERHLRRARRKNAARRRALLEAIGHHLGDRFEVTGEGSGAHVTLWPRARCSEETLIARAAERGVGIAGISQYYVKPNSRPGLLLGYARLSESQIRDGIARLAAVI
jgi:GntR family transcriptional regulator/MocR family aminotransferase